MGIRHVCAVLLFLTSPLSATANEKEKVYKECLALSHAMTVVDSVRIRDAVAGLYPAGTTSPLKDLIESITLSISALQTKPLKNVEEAKRVYLEALRDIEPRSSELRNKFINYVGDLAETKNGRAVAKANANDDLKKFIRLKFMKPYVGCKAHTVRGIRRLALSKHFRAAATHMAGSIARAVSPNGKDLLQVILKNVNKRMNN